jgi:putative nucleotidyltransferase with HDIG domain
MNIQELVSSVKSLPPAPRVLVRLLEVVRNPDADSDSVLEVLQIDAALTAEIIRTSNTAYFSSSTPVASLDEAVARLGYLEVYRMAARVPAGKMFGGAIDSMGIAAGELFEHSLACAIVADELGQRIDLESGLAYTTGLLHDIGKLVLHERCADQYEKVFTLIEAEQMTLIEAERSVLGFDHAQVGGALLEHWKFPAEIHNAVRHQYDPKACPDPKFLAAALLISNWAAGALGCNHGRDVWAISIDDDVRKLAHLEPEDIELLVVNSTARLHSAIAAVSRE